MALESFKYQKNFEQVQNVYCPQCNSLMQKRNGRRGEFYGCTMFFVTGCRGIRQVKDVEIYGQGIENEEHIEPIKKQIVKQKIDIIETSKFPYLNFKFKQFNPVQSEVFQYYNKDLNCVVAASTSAGKTTIAEMFMAYSISKGKKAIFLSPLKAVSQEKFNDWTNPSHDWSKLNVSIVTGDYQLTEKRIEELNQANIIIMTCEMLDSRTRRINIEKNNWLLEADTIVQDECHLLHSKERGNRLESAIMRFTKQNPSCRIVFLSATMPNVDELARWLSSLNSKKTELINSDYRPIELGIHFEHYDDVGKYQSIEKNKIQKTIDIALEKYKKGEQVLIFVHAKSTGRYLYNELLNNGINLNEIDFHFGDLELNKRLIIESKTRSKEIKILIATSTLAWGINI